MFYILLAILNCICKLLKFHLLTKNSVVYCTLWLVLLLPPAPLLEAKDYGLHDL